MFAIPPTMRALCSLRPVGSTGGMSTIAISPIIAVRATIHNRKDRFTKGKSASAVSPKIAVIAKKAPKMIFDQSMTA